MMKSIQVFKKLFDLEQATGEKFDILFSTATLNAQAKQ